MPSEKLTGLPDIGAPDLTDLMYLVRPSLGVAGSFSVLVSALRSFILAGVPRAFPPDTTTVGNVLTGLTNLQSFSLPAGSLANDGDYFKVRYGGLFGGNNNNKAIDILFGGNTVRSDSQTINGLGWIYDIIYTRIAATTVRVTYDALWGFINRTAAGVLSGNTNQFVIPVPDITVSDLNSNAQTLLVQAQGGATNDIVQNLSTYELVQF